MLDMSNHDRQYFDCLIKYVNSDISDYTTFFKDGHLIFGVWGLQLNGQKDISMAIRTDIDDRRVYSITYQMSGNGILSQLSSASTGTRCQGLLISLMLYPMKGMNSHLGNRMRLIIRSLIQTLYSRLYVLLYLKFPNQSPSIKKTFRLLSLKLNIQ